MKKELSNKCINLCGFYGTEFCNDCKGKRETVYTMEQWDKDGTIAAEVMQEIEEDIYNQMLNAMPPIYLQPMMFFGSQGLAMIKQCIAMGEAYTHEYDRQGRLCAYFMAFGVCNGKYYYLGLRNGGGELMQYNSETEKRLNNANIN
jgi:hypothetical protein